MSEILLRQFLTKNKNTAFTWSAIRNRVRIPDLSRKLNQQVKYGFVDTLEGIIYSKSRGRITKTKYYYIGSPNRFVPKPKEILFN